jgi:calcium channel MID1
MLPAALLLLLNAAISVAQTRTSLSINYVLRVSEPPPIPPYFIIPTASQLAISVALCSGATDAAGPRFFVTNSSSDASPGSAGGDNVFEIILNQGHGNWSGVFPSGGVLGVEDAQIPFEIGVSNGIPIHEVLLTPPLLGDTTATQALLFSPPFAPQNTQDPNYPNYTLPVADPPIPAAPANSLNYTVVVSPTSNSLASLPQTACMLTNQKSSGTIANQSLWLRDASGWRTEWLMTGLTAKTNYTAYVIESNYKVSGPIYFTTKSCAYTSLRDFATELTPLQQPSPVRSSPVFRTARQ